MGTRRGFTLLELLMVVIIIAILASVALPQYLRTTERARTGEALNILGAIRESEMRFKALNPATSFTDDLNLLDIDVPGVNNTVAPPSIAWNLFNVDVSTGRAQATRSGGGATGGGILAINLINGSVCAPGNTNAANAWGVAASGC